MPDAYFSNVALLAPFDGLTAGTVLLQDRSNANRPLTLGNSAALSATQAKFGGNSLYLPGATAYAQAPASNDWAFGTGDFTIELWANITTAGTIINQWNYGTSGAWLFGSSGTTIYCYTNTDLTFTSSTFASVLNTWVHFAFARAGDTARLFVNGALVGTKTGLAAVPYGVATYTLRVGSHVLETLYSMIGYVDDVRITAGVARYTAAFTPPGALEYAAATLAMPVAQAPARSRDYWNGGNGRITGVVKALSTPVARRVRLHHQGSGIVLAETWSDASGNYAFNYLDPAEKYVVIGFDYTGSYGAVIADNITPSV